MTKPLTTRTPPTLCAHCGYMVDAASAAGDTRPEPGDWTVCLRCGGVLTFDDTLRPVLPALGAYDALRISDPEFYAEIEQASADARRMAARGGWIPDRGHQA
jgi:hypothetical protein